MRRLGRYIFNGLTGLSLIVCLATGVLWVRGNWCFDTLIGGHQGHVWTINLGSGHASFEFETAAKRVIAPSSPSFDLEGYWGSGPTSVNVLDRDWRWPGLSFYSQHTLGIRGPTIYNSRFAVSYWLILLLTLILPASRIRFRNRQRLGLCPQCRYDLRATPDRCPECGTVVAEAGKKQGSATEDTEHTEEERKGRHRSSTDEHR